MIEKNTTVFDFETTGIKQKDDRIIEIAAVKIQNGKIVGTFSQLINPEHEISKEITDLTGISNDDVRGCPTIQEVMPFFIKRILSDSLLVAHNALFDLYFLEATIERLYNRKNAIRNSFIDTRTISIDAFPYKSHKLGDLCERLEIKLEGAHRALNDVLATWELLKALNKDEIATCYVNRLYFYKKYGDPEWTPDYAEVSGLGR